MKTNKNYKVIYKDFQIHNVPLERIEYDIREREDTKIFLDDANEKRWVIKPVVLLALKMTASDYAPPTRGTFPEECYVKSDMGIMLFRRHILELENSEWIQALKANWNEGDSEWEVVNKARHFVLPLYDNHIEFIAWDIILEEADNI